MKSVAIGVGLRPSLVRLADFVHGITMSLDSRQLRKRAASFKATLVTPSSESGSPTTTRSRRQQAWGGVHHHMFFYLLFLDDRTPSDKHRIDEAQ